MTDSAEHVDNFARNSLPAKSLQPEFLFDLPGLQYADKINCVDDILDKHIQGVQAEKIAIICGEQRWSYQQLFDTANRIAHVLVDEWGLLPGNRVLLHSPNNPMLAACWFAVLKAGGIAVATMSMLRSRDLIPVIDKAQIRFALCDARLQDAVYDAQRETEVLQKIMLFDASVKDDAVQLLNKRMSNKPALFDNIKTGSDDVALIAFTSGTTGNPKGTMHYHCDVLSMAHCVSDLTLKPGADDVFIGSPPLAFTFGLGALLVFPLRAGATTVLLENGSPFELAAAIEKYRATICFTSPTGYRGLLDAASTHKLDSLKKCVSAGEALNESTFTAWKEKTGIALIDGIGSTEMLHIFISATGSAIKPGATGKPIAGYQACIIGEDNRKLEPDQQGRLAVKGPTGCRYLADERQKNYVINGWNVTGDIYRMDKHGYFYFVGRGDDMIVSSGYNISGTEIEGALSLHPAVDECAVVALADHKRGNVPKAFVVVRSGYVSSQGLVEELQDFVKVSIAPYKYPRAIEFIDALPKTESGKIQRFKLRK